jgi:hypothetical protein
MVANALCASVCATAAQPSAKNVNSTANGLNVFDLLIALFLSGFSFWFARALPRVLRFYESFQVVEARCPKHTVLIDPGIDSAQGLRIKLVNPVPPFPMFTNQVGASQ